FVPVGESLFDLLKVPAVLYKSDLFPFLVAPHSGIYTLSLPDALPISLRRRAAGRGRKFTSIGYELHRFVPDPLAELVQIDEVRKDRKSTRLNSSQDQTSYAVFCLKKKRSHSAWIASSCRCCATTERSQ